MLMSTNVQRYTAIKRGLGYKFYTQEQTLQNFAALADLCNDKYTSVSRMIEWASLAPSRERSRERLFVVRQFAIWLRAEDGRNEIPPPDVFGRGKRPRPRPHILTAANIERLMHAAMSVPPLASITPHTYHYLIGLMASTGLRVSEAVALVEPDITNDGLLIRETKFHKTRLVPIHSSTRAALADYLTLRRRIGGPDPHVFVLSTGKSPSVTTVSRTFLSLARQIGLRSPQGETGPHLHDLRHSFAVRSLLT
jgi:integrase/recombinase XerD